MSYAFKPIIIYNEIHNIENIGDKKMTAIFWISEIYNKVEPDTFYEKV